MSGPSFHSASTNYTSIPMHHIKMCPLHTIKAWEREGVGMEKEVNRIFNRHWVIFY